MPANTSAQSAAVSATTQAAPALTITTVSPLPAATVGVAYSGTFTATGGTAPYTWSISAGSLPAGLTLSSGGVLSGTPSTAATANFTVQCSGGSATTKAFSLTVNGSVTSTAWAMDIGGAGSDMGYSVATDASGNIYVVGPFAGTVNFGGGNLVSAGAADIFVAKYSPSGTGLWAMRFGGLGDDQARAVAVDKNGDVLVTGYFSMTCTFGSSTYTALGTADAFVLKLSGASGAVLWSKQIGGQFGSGSLFNVGYGITAGTNGDVIVTGQVAGWTDFGGGINYNYSLDPNTFLVRYSSTGQYLWAKEFNCASQDSGKAVAVDAQDNIFLAGIAQGPIDLGTGQLANPGAPFNATYLAKLTASGSTLWSKAFTAVAGVGLNSLSLDRNGNIALAGYFNGSLDFGNGPLASNGQSGFVAKLSPTGAAVWSKALVGSIYYSFGSSSAAGVGVTFDGAGNVAVVGQFWEQCNFGGGNLIVPSVGTGDGFLAKYAAANGSYLSAIQFGGTGNDWGTSVAVDGSGNAIVVGTTNGGNFNGATLTSHGGYDAFIMKVLP